MNNLLIMSNTSRERLGQATTHEERRTKVERIAPTQVEEISDETRGVAQALRRARLTDCFKDIEHGGPYSLTRERGA
jgi:hypothetical protein